ncbi:MAG: glycosyltransferase family 4 protein [Acidobacteria bacterium]|nr:glycosyltransferase family 4 protein [Acidobacteriota bacterium]MDW7985404.1 glycosyltransferase family 4 protein [Acidobacteriota bacterium]
MRWNVVIYCPDTHILYDATLPDRKGVGGGLMARLRLAQALARQGHCVTVIAHVTRPHVHRGVTYLPLDQADRPRTADVLILGSSGGALSLEAARDLPIKASWRAVWVQGTVPIRGLDHLAFDCIIPCSNFIWHVIRRDWGLAERLAFVIYNGFPRRRGMDCLGSWLRRRHPFRLIYTSHPDKGLATALKVLDRLRTRDPRYHLWVFGGDALYGGQDTALPSAPGVTYMGTRSQPQVLRALERSAVALCLQDRLEPFGMVLTEAMHSGAIPVASPVGAYAEIVRHGWNGILVPGDHRSEEVQSEAADWIHYLTQRPDWAATLRRNARCIPWDWDTQARVWTDHWAWVLQGQGRLLKGRNCPTCEGRLLQMADGPHCGTCGLYFPYGIQG